jgi:hypothetical protein
MCMEIKTPTYSTCNIRIRQLVIIISTSLNLVNSQLFWTSQHGYSKGKGESNSYLCYRMVLYSTRGPSRAGAQSQLSPTHRQGAFITLTSFRDRVSDCQSCQIFSAVGFLVQGSYSYFFTGVSELSSHYEKLLLHMHRDARISICVTCPRLSNAIPDL